MGKDQDYSNVLQSVKRVEWIDHNHLTETEKQEKQCSNASPFYLSLFFSFELFGSLKFQSLPPLNLPFPIGKIKESNKGESET